MDEFPVPQVSLRATYSDRGCRQGVSKASKVVTNPERVRYQTHDAPLTAEHVATERTWMDIEDYERQQAAIEDATDTEQ